MCITESLLTFLNSNGAEMVAIVDDDETRRLVLGHCRLKVALHRYVDVIGKAHHRDAWCCVQMIHSVFVNLAVGTFTQIELDALILFEESTQMMLSLFPVITARIVLIFLRNIVRILT